MNFIVKRLMESRVSEAVEAETQQYVFRIPWREAFEKEYDAEYHYEFEDMEYAEEIMNAAEENFNEIPWTHYTHTDDRVSNCGILAMAMSFTPSGECMITVTTDSELSEPQVDKLKDYLEGQMSDGWGEGFEQREIARFTEEDEEWIEDYEDEDDGGYYDTVQTTIYVAGQFWWSSEEPPYSIELVTQDASMTESADSVRMEFSTEEDAQDYAGENGYKIDKIQTTRFSCVAWMSRDNEA